MLIVPPYICLVPTRWKQMQMAHYPDVITAAKHCPLHFYGLKQERGKGWEAKSPKLGRKTLASL